MSFHFKYDECIKYLYFGYYLNLLILWWSVKVELFYSTGLCAIENKARSVTFMLMAWFLPRRCSRTVWKSDLPVKLCVIYSGICIWPQNCKCWWHWQAVFDMNNNSCKMFKTILHRQNRLWLSRKFYFSRLNEVNVYVSHINYNSSSKHINEKTNKTCFLCWLV